MSDYGRAATLLSPVNGRVYHVSTGKFRTNGLGLTLYETAVFEHTGCFWFLGRNIRYVDHPPSVELTEESFQAVKDMVVGQDPTEWSMTRGSVRDARELAWRRWTSI